MAFYPENILEEELKNRVGSDWFDKYDYKKIIGKVDFCVSVGEFNLIWGEAKRGTSHDIYESFIQLILTLGKARTFDNNMPPTYLCAFDAEKIAFIEYSNVLDIFYQNDFNWNVAPSDHKTKEFKQLKDRVIEVLEREKYLYNYEDDEDELLEFIEGLGTESASPLVQIDKNNFINIYLKWRVKVMPSIAVNWEKAKAKNYLEADFYIADVISSENETIRDTLKVVLKLDHYEFDKIEEDGIFTTRSTTFRDNGNAHREFWKKYQRPPREIYQDYIIERRDLLVPQDIRERKGSFFTPRAWVEVAQEALAEELGENWQEEYYVWDCCAGTGNLLVGLHKPYNIYASTIDKADVDIMQSMIKAGTKQLAPEHVFEFDFLNDTFDKLPPSLREIVSNEEKRKKLVIFINPPYAEAGNIRQTSRTGENKGGVAIENLVYQKYAEMIGNASNELFALFLIRIYKEISGCVIGNFSKMKVLQAPNFKRFRNVFEPRLCSLFLLPANTFDNVNGKFPIGFHVWRTDVTQPFKRISATIYNHKRQKIGKKVFKNLKNKKTLNQWLKKYKSKTAFRGYLMADAPDFQNQKHVGIVSKKGKGHWIFNNITAGNLIYFAVYFAVRHAVKHTWLNDRDQFLYPKNTWLKDREFHNDCLAYTLFHGQNRISSADGVNHWIPFTEMDVRPRDRYHSHFMIDFLNGKVENEEEIFKNEDLTVEPVVFSAEAQAVMNSARKLYRYYHGQKDANPDASFYDIRLFFQGTDEKGRMSASSGDEKYNELMNLLRKAQRTLAKKIEAKVYEHGFLEE